MRLIVKGILPWTRQVIGVITLCLAIGLSGCIDAESPDDNAPIHVDVDAIFQIAEEAVTEYQEDNPDVELVLSEFSKDLIHISCPVGFPFCSATVEYHLVEATPKEFLSLAEGICVYRKPYTSISVIVRSNGLTRINGPSKGHTQANADCETRREF